MGERTLTPESLPLLLNQRSLKGSKVSSRFQRKRHATRDLIDRLGLYQELEGHNGCVNCLEWNKSGQLLASGSDDKTVILWNGDTGEKLVQLPTHHDGNIFSVKFLPETDDRRLVTGAQDSRVCLLDAEEEKVVQSATLHLSRVKRLAVSYDTPGIFWSAAEDGTVMQWDTRERWRPNEANVLINLVKHTGREAEVKCISVCPTRPHLIAIGANDPYVRLYDRRMLSLSRLYEEEGAASNSNTGGITSNWERRNRLFEGEGKGDATPHKAVTYFVPWHLPDHGRESRYSLGRPLTATYLAFSPDGEDLVVNLGGEQVYIYDRFSLFDSSSSTSPSQTLAVLEICDSKTYDKTSSGSSSKRSSLSRPSSSSPSPIAPLTPSVSLLKSEANSEFERERYSQALYLYNLAIARQPHPVLYGNRAAALMKRHWSGDLYAALRDCVRALTLDPGHIKAHLRLARCLHDLNWTDEAVSVLQLFKERYPEHIKSQACSKLEKDLQAAAEKKSAAKKEPSKKSSSRGANSTNSSNSGTTAAGGGGEGWSAQDFIRGLEDWEQETNPPDIVMEDEDEVMEADQPVINLRNGHQRRMSEQEAAWRLEARDYTTRYLGSCNTTTDIKEANFFGNDGQYVVAGSDDGKFYIWDRVTTNVVKVLVGDDSIVNCLQGHPTAPILATSGIDSVVRIWQPLPRDGKENEREVKEWQEVVTENQTRMCHDPFEMFLMRVNNSLEGQQGEGNESALQCRPV